MAGARRLLSEFPYLSPVAARSCMVKLIVECIMGRYITPETVLRNRRQKQVV